MTNHNSPVALHPSHQWHYYRGGATAISSSPVDFLPASNQAYNSTTETVQYLGRTSISSGNIPVFFDWIPIFRNNHKLVFSFSSSWAFFTRHSHMISTLIVEISKIWNLHFFLNNLYSIYQSPKQFLINVFSHVIYFLFFKYNKNKTIPTIKSSSLV